MWPVERIELVESVELVITASDSDGKPTVEETVLYPGSKRAVLGGYIAIIVGDVQLVRVGRWYQTTVNGEPINMMYPSILWEGNTVRVVEDKDTWEEVLIQRINIRRIYR